MRTRFEPMLCKFPSVSSSYVQVTRIIVFNNFLHVNETEDSFDRPFFTCSRLINPLGTVAVYLRPWRLTWEISSQICLNEVFGIDFFSLYVSTYADVTNGYTYSAPKPKIGRPALTNQPIRLTARHFPSLVPQTTERENPQRKCVVCARPSRRPEKRTDSRYMCRDCDVCLCVVSCFEEYHTVLHF